ncbi:unnamed protein product [Arabidopsis lyrata]|nr:unnamed protein product [Arabidopsis lyrata]
MESRMADLRAVSADKRGRLAMSVKRLDQSSNRTKVVKIDGRVVSDGKVGRVTRTLQNAYKKDRGFWCAILIFEKVQPHPVVINLLTRVEEIRPKWKIVPTKDVIDAAFKDLVRDNKLIYQDKPRLKTALEIFRTNNNTFLCITRRSRYSDGSRDKQSPSSCIEWKEHVLFEAILCQIFDMIKPESRVLSNHNMKDNCISLHDLHASKLSGNVLNILFNRNKFMAPETHDPFLIRQEYFDLSHLVNAFK